MWYRQPMKSSARHLPLSLDEARARGWDALDVVLVTGDAAVDHPAFPAALIGRALEAAGFRVGLIARPDPNDPAAVAQFGLPRLFFGVTAGALDSMVANYTALKRRRSDDAFAPGGRAGGRPDRALTAYGNLLRRAFGKAAFLVAGGLEASLRRFAHYDYWSDSVRRPILMDCGADVLVYGMGEGPAIEIARRLAALSSAAGEPTTAARLAAVRDVPGVVYREPKSRPAPMDGVALPSAEEVANDAKMHARAFHLFETRRDRRQWQDCGGMRVIANPPWPPASPDELDALYELPFTRDAHPSLREPVPALEQVRFSAVSHRGCCGGCAFCAIGAHQGKTIVSRSTESIRRELARVAAHPRFHGVVNDIGGPTANMYGLACGRDAPCDRPSCLWPERCAHLRADQTPYLELLRAARETPGVKRVFVTTGIRTDLAVLSEALIRELAREHTSGLLKVAPEHVVPQVLHAMRKPPIDSFLAFLEMHRRFSREAGKEQYVLPYLVAALPGSTMTDMVVVHDFLKTHRIKVEQCQIFTPTPGTAATVMYATGLDPATLRPVFVERDPKKKEMQKALILHHLPENARLIQAAKATAKNDRVDPPTAPRVKRTATTRLRGKRE